jgi:hypothetical protein
MFVAILATVVLAVVSAAPQNYGAKAPLPDAPSGQYGGKSKVPVPDPIKPQPANSYGGAKLPSGDDTDKPTNAYQGGQRPLGLPVGGSDTIDTSKHIFGGSSYGGGKRTDTKVVPADPILPSNSYGGFKQPMPPSDVPAGNGYGSAPPADDTGYGSDLSDHPDQPSNYGGDVIADPILPDNSYGAVRPEKPADPVMPDNSYGGFRPEKPADPVMPDNSYGGARPKPQPLPADLPKGSGYGGADKRPADPQNPYGAFVRPIPPKDTLPIAPNPYGGAKRPSDPVKPSNPYA